MKKLIMVMAFWSSTSLIFAEDRIVDQQIHSDGSRSYTATYQFTGPKGLVRIHDGIWTSQNNMLVVITRHENNSVVVKATADRETVKRFNTVDDRDGFVCLPWLDNHSCHGSVRGGNRLSIFLQEGVTYYITVPHDADVEVTLDKGGNIIYDSAAGTRVDATARSINSYYNRSSGGCSSHPKQEDGVYVYNKLCDYYSETRLTTIHGHIDLPCPTGQQC